MRTRRNGYRLGESYAGYGLTKERVKTLLKECMAGKHTELVQEAARRAEPDISKWVISSIVEGKSLRDMGFEWALGKMDIMPCCRNSFYSYRKLTIAILAKMLDEEG